MQQVWHSSERVTIGPYSPQELYRQTTDTVRRQLNQAFFDKLYLDADEVIDDRLAEPFNDFLYRRTPSRRRIMHNRERRIGTNGATWDAAGGMSTSAALLDASRVAGFE
jgi:hypothetical protein